MALAGTEAARRRAVRAMMPAVKRTTFLIAGLAAAAPTPAAAFTIGPLDARPNPLVFGKSTQLTGQLADGDAAGKTVGLEVDEVAPFGDEYVPLAGVTATTDAAGRFAFTLRPELNTMYRAVAQTAPPATSQPRLILVRPAIGLFASDRTPRRGQLVRFRGTVRPDAEGRVLIQRRLPSGRYKTVAGTPLRDTGPAYSTYARRLRIRRSGTYRVRIAGDEEHTDGFSRALRLRVR
jgi:hypothetical protein